MDPAYYALVYETVTGTIIDEIPLQSIPQWNQTINSDGVWTITTQIGPDNEDDPSNESGALSKLHLRSITDHWRHSVAICWGTGQPTDYVAQAGPITARKLVSEQPPVLQIGGTGFWPLLRKMLQVAPNWNGQSVAAGAGADTTYTSSLQGIATAMLLDARQRQQNLLNHHVYALDVPAAIPGTAVRNFFGYEFTSIGQRLQELTQGVDGPDILFKPYLTGTGFVAHQALIGNPTLGAAGNPLYFDYPGSIVSLLPTDDGTNESTTSYEKGSGIDAATLWAKSTDTTLTDAGWPILEDVDNTHGDVTDQATLQSYADGAQAFNGRPLSTWNVVVRQDDEDYPFGSYDPGFTATYNLDGHPWELDGEYDQRVLGFQNGTNVKEFVHLLQNNGVS